jgi:immune inhibitor A
MPANPKPATVRQPDGANLTIRLHGDEVFGWHTDQTGEPILKREDGWWVYAREDGDRLVASDRIAGRSDLKNLGFMRPDTGRLWRAASTRRHGTVDPYAVEPGAKRLDMMKNLVILVSFSNLTVDYPRASFDSLFNIAGYAGHHAQGSVRDYYREASFYAFDIYSTVVAPVTLPNTFQYYGQDDGESLDINARAMVSDALAALNTRGFDFSIVDGNDDGWVDGFCLIHAGGGQEFSGNDSDYIWSHQGRLASAVQYDGVWLQKYHTEGARHGWDADPDSWDLTRIGVICHETGHFLGLPDLYDRDGGSIGGGWFCLMASGGQCGDGAIPTHFNAWCKMQLGWLLPTLIANAGVYSLGTYAASPTAYEIIGTSPSPEYFLIENRQGVGFDRGLPGPNRGLIIWHVDPSAANNDNPSHYKVDVEEASGTQHLEAELIPPATPGDDYDYFRAGGATRFGVGTIPANFRYDGMPANLDVSEISASGPTMTFRVTHTDVWVDFASTATPEQGTWILPFNTLQEAVAVAPPGGRICIKPGHRLETPTITRQLTIDAPLGTAAIGR